MAHHLAIIEHRHGVSALYHQPTLTHINKRCFNQSVCSSDQHYLAWTCGCHMTLCSSCRSTILITASHRSCWATSATMCDARGATELASAKMWGRSKSNIKVTKNRQLSQFLIFTLFTTSWHRKWFAWKFLPSHFHLANIRFSFFFCAYISHVTFACCVCLRGCVCVVVVSFRRVTNIGWWKLTHTQNAGRTPRDFVKSVRAQCIGWNLCQLTYYYETL